MLYIFSARLNERLEVNVMNIIMSTVVVSGVGLIVGIILGVADIFLCVKVDEREGQILEILPGYNCGACGYPGCDGFAAAVSKGEAPSNGCRAGGPKVAAAVLQALGGAQ